ncbi:MAG: glycine cleavage system protein GcvH [Acholeplasmatales bacterium]|jgi:glycine cleavage system H protein|nr:glycine cleavage system protein GcvH [Acholeplasmatales bacterium]
MAKYYTKTHEWVDVVDNLGRVGITKHATDLIGEVVFLELPSKKEYKKGDVIASVESIKAVSEVYAPLSGKVVELDSELSDNPEKVTEDPENRSLFTVEILDLNELKDLLSEEDYNKTI